MSEKKSKADLIPYILLISYLLGSLGLIAARATGLIGWHWVWVTAPLWIPVTLALMAVLAAENY